ncbi:MAG: carboxypeptidase-like regulatory domain-containing protein, partial [Paludibacteraceae bacterium]
MKIRNLTLFFMLAMSLSLFAQQRNITGKVVDSNGEPIIGASVLVKGTNLGVVTNIDGDFKLSVPGTASVLTIRYVGKNPKEVQITGDVMNVTLEDDQKVLDEVVVIGYGSV